MNSTCLKCGSTNMDTSGLYCLSCGQNHYIKFPGNIISTVEEYTQELYERLQNDKENNR